MKDKNFRIEFKCPECGGDQIEVVERNVTQLSTVTHVGKVNNSVYANYGESSYEDGDPPSEYRCLYCSTLLKLSSASKVESDEELLEWLQERNMLIEE